MHRVLVVGAEAWIDCEVKPGPFSDERLVRVKKNGDTWVGFVNAAQLRPPIPETGQTKVRVRLIKVEGNSFVGQILGHSVTPQPIHGTLDEVEAVDTGQARNSPLPH
jgi:hypothetical protein